MFFGAGGAQAGEGVDAGFVSIFPEDAEGVVAHQLGAGDAVAGQRTDVEAQRIGGGGAALLATGGAGAVGAQPVQPVGADLVVCPGELERLANFFSARGRW